MRILLFIPLLFLAACGLHPVYGQDYQENRAGVTADLAEISVVTGTDRLGQLLGEELRDNLNPTRKETEKLFRLTVTANETNIPLFVAPDGTYGRGNIQFASTYKIVRISDGLVIDIGNVTQMSSYAASETNAIYASYVAQQDARKRGIIELARRVSISVANRLNDSELHSLKDRVPVTAPNPIVAFPDTSSLTTLGVDR